MKYSLQILKNKSFSRDSNILPQMHWTLDIFGHSATIIGGLGVSLNYPILNFKKTVFRKTYGCSTAGKKYFTSASQAFYTRTKSSYSKARSSHQRCSIKKGVLRNFVKFTGKQLWQSLFLIKLQDSGLQLY